MTKTDTDNSYLTKAEHAMTKVEHAYMNAIGTILSWVVMLAIGGTIGVVVLGVIKWAWRQI